MQYLLSVIDEVTGSATAQELAATSEFNSRLRADGHWVFAGGLAAPATASVFDSRGERTVVTDGPFGESKEYLAGLWIIDAADDAVALGLADAASRACGRRVELRAFLAT